MFYIARFSVGVGVGIAFTIGYCYIAEIAPKQTRGTIGLFGTIALAGGMVVTMAIMPYIDWKLSNSLFLILQIIQFIITLFALESPYLYIRKGDLVEAKNVLQKLRTGNIDKEFLEITEYVKSMENDKVGPSVFITNIVYRKAMLYSTIIIVGQQLTGLAPTLAYAGDVVAPGGDIIDPDLAILLFGLVPLGMIILSTYFVDRNGRRILLIISGSICILSNFLIATYFFLKSQNWEHVESIRLFPTIGFIVMNVGMGVGFSSLPYVYMNDLMPNAVRPMGGFYLTCVGGIMGFILTQMFLWMQDSFGLASPFIMYCVSLFVCLILIGLFLPETKGLSFLEIHTMLQGSKDKKSAEVNKS